MSDGNTKGNTAPDAAVLEQMRKMHRISWHPRGGWCRKFPGDDNRTYFGRVTPEEAVRQCVLIEDRKARGEREAARATALTVKDALNRFLTHLDGQLRDGKIRDAQRARYGRELDRLIKFTGKNRRLADFCKLNAPEELFAPLRKSAHARGVFACEKHVTNVRAFLDWCSRRRHIPAPFYADAFDLPGDKEKRSTKKAKRKAKGTAYWSPGEVVQWIEVARAESVHREAQVLLMLNGGMGATDLSNLEDEDIDWQRKCIHTDRSKTLVPRVIPLWPETLEAMRRSRDVRAKPASKEWGNRFFLTARGYPLVLEHLKPGNQKLKRSDTVKNWFYLMLNGDKARAAKLPGLKRHGAGAYTMRSVFTTLSLGHGGDRNLEAVILGQQFDRPILEFYIRDDQREKLIQVVNHVRRQLWPHL